MTMRIALLTNFIPPYRISLYTQIAHLVGKMKVHIATEMESNRNWKVDHGKLEVIVQKSWSFSKTWRHQGGFSETSQIHIPYNTISLLKKQNPDVVISSELGMRSLLASIYCRLTDKPLILWLTLSEHTETNKGFTRKILRKFLLNTASALLGNGKSCERYVRSLGCTKPMFFVPYTSDFTVLKSKKTFSESKKVLFTGQLIQRKGIAEMIQALNVWSTENPDKHIELTLAGDGPEMDHFKVLKTANIRLKLLGNIPYSELKKRYEQADYYLFPTLADEWGVVVNEALSSGVPVIGSIYSQAVEELIQEGVNGWLFKPDKTRSFVGALDKAFSSSEEKLEEMSQNCTRSIEDYSPASVAKTIKKALDFVVQQK